jgi:hypothetical protein
LLRAEKKEKKMSESSLKKKRTKQQSDEGHVWVWGDNSLGQLLDLPACDEVIAPRLVEKHLVVALCGGFDKLRRAPEDCVDAAQGDGHWIALSESGELRGAGRSQEGQLGVMQREMVQSVIPIAPQNNVRVTSVACGGRHSAFLSDVGTLFTFGCNSFGQLGHSAGQVVVSIPTVVGELWFVSVIQVSLGGNHSAAVTSTGRLFLWGCNTAGQCAAGPDVLVAPVAMVEKLDPIREAACGFEHTLALVRGSGEVLQWGGVSMQQPVRALSIAAGYSHSAAVVEGGGVVCWGDASRGATASRTVRNVSRVVCGRHWTAAYTPARLPMPNAAATTPLSQGPWTPVLGGSLAAFSSLEQLEQAMGGPQMPNLRVGAQSTRALLPLVGRALLHGASHPKERHALGAVLLRAGATTAGPSEVEQAAALLSDCDALTTAMEDAANRHWAGQAQIALSDHLVKTRMLSRALSMPLMHFLSLLRSAAPPTTTPPARFYNDVVSRRLDVMSDYERWTRGLPSVCGDFPWLLLPFAKAAVLQEEARISMDQMYADAVVREMLGRHPSSPFLEIVVRRDHIISDTMERLAELETRNSTRAFRKKLKVTFEDEQGLDEGGVTKEYFLLLVRQLFQPEYALVTWDENKSMCWFNPAALENESEFKLVGIVFGLAIYNSTILDVHFPPIIYSYLLNPDYVPTFEDLKVFERNVSCFCFFFQKKKKKKKNFSFFSFRVLFPSLLKDFSNCWTIPMTTWKTCFA